jgi:hypothetical protein
MKQLELKLNTGKKPYKYSPKSYANGTITRDRCKACYQCSKQCFAMIPAFCEDKKIEKATLYFATGGYGFYKRVKDSNIGR